jgi:HK97 family phage major capsid protein
MMKRVCQVTRPTAGRVEERTAELSLEGRRIRSRVPFGVESRDLGGFREVIEPHALRDADLSDLVARVEHDGLPLARFPNTLQIDRGDGAWSFEPPQSRQDVVEAISRGDLRASSFRMVVDRDRWVGDVRHVESIRALRDVSLVALPAYPDAAVEYRSQSNPAEGQEGRTMADEATAIAEETAQDTEDRPTEDQVSEDLQESAEDRSGAEDRSEQPSGGGRLRVEDRREESYGESRVLAELDAELHRVPAGESRALTDSISIAPTTVGTTLFDRLRAQAVVLASGIRILPIGAKAETWPTITGDVSPAMYSEGATITPGDPTFGSITATPRKVAHLVQLDNEVIDDSSPAAIGVLNDHLLKVFALKVDAELLEGSGTAPEIRGLKNVASIQTTAAATNGTSATFDILMSALALLDNVSVPLDRVAVVGHTRNKATLRALRSIANGEYLLDSALTALGMSASQFYWTPQLSTNETQGTSGAVCNSIYLYDTQNVIFVPRQAPQIVLDRSRLFNSDQSELRCTMRCDLMVPQPSAVVRVTGFTS